MTNIEPQITEQVANDLYDVLAAHAGATDYQRENFVSVQSRERCVEYRFGGALGFGGKFWRNDGRWCVNAYREDETAGRMAQINATNIALGELRASLADGA